MPERHRNFSVDFLKLFFISIIVLHHSGLLSHFLYRANFAVEFFFFLSGYFICYTFEKGVSFSDFVKKRIKKLFPGYLSAYILISLVYFFLGEFKYKAPYGPFLELLMFQSVGIPNSEGINYPLWYLSVLFYGGILLFFMKRVINHKLFNVICVLIVVIVYSYLCFNPNGVELWGYCFDVIYIPFWRGVADLIIGMWIYYLPKLSYKIGRVLQLTSFFATIILFFIPGNLNYILTVFPALLVYVSTTNKTVFDGISNNPILLKCYPYQYYIFLNHALGIRICHYAFSHIELPVPIEILIILCTVAFFAIVMKAITDSTVRLFETALKKTR